MALEGPLNNKRAYRYQSREAPMRNHKDRRKTGNAPISPYEDNGRATLARDRRKNHERRIENLEMEERQLMLSEMPAPIIKDSS